MTCPNFAILDGHCSLTLSRHYLSMVCSVTTVKHCTGLGGQKQSFCVVSSTNSVILNGVEFKYVFVYQFVCICIENHKRARTYLIFGLYLKSICKYN